MGVYGNSYSTAGTDVAAVWGQITGTLSDQTDLNTSLSGKYAVANLLSETAATNRATLRANAGMGPRTLAANTNAAASLTLDLSLGYDFTYAVAQAQEITILLPTNAHAGDRFILAIEPSTTNVLTIALGSGLTKSSDILLNPSSNTAGPDLMGGRVRSDTSKANITSFVPFMA